MVEDQPGDIEPVYLALEDVLGLHGLIIGATAAEAADQLRNRDGLESALARPEAYAHYDSADLVLRRQYLPMASLRASSSLTATSALRWSPCSLS